MPRRPLDPKSGRHCVFWPGPAERIERYIESCIVHASLLFRDRMIVIDN